MFLGSTGLFTIVIHNQIGEECLAKLVRSTGCVDSIWLCRIRTRRCAYDTEDVLEHEFPPLIKPSATGQFGALILRMFPDVERGQATWSSFTVS
jgi:hypothetical protein